MSLIAEASTYEGDLRKIIEMVIDRTGLVTALEVENTTESRARIENIKEFLTVVDEFVATHDEDDALFEAPSTEDLSAADADALLAADQVEGALFDTSSFDEEAQPARTLRGDSMADFLEWVRLRTDLDAQTEDGATVTLMTVHAAKGLEFDTVFVAGMEETIFPHMNSSSDPAGIEEERRLAYVAITRARKKLFLTCAASRQLFGNTQSNPVSRFIGEIPQELRFRFFGLFRHGLREARKPPWHFWVRLRSWCGTRVWHVKRFGFAKDVFCDAACNVCHLV